MTAEEQRPFAREVVERKAHFRALLRSALRSYFGRRFHPEQEENYHLAEAYLESIGRLEA